MTYNKAGADGLIQMGYALEKQAEGLYQTADKMVHDFLAKSRNIEDWHGLAFSYDRAAVKEFSLFARRFKKTIEDLLGPDYKVVNFRKGHYFLNGFIQNIKTEKMVYFGISDVRYFGDAWFDRVLVRTAKDDHDYTGGTNNYVPLMDIKSIVDRLSI